MRAGSRNLKGALYILLSQNILEIQTTHFGLFWLPKGLWLQNSFSVQSGSQITDIADAVNFRSPGKCCLSRIFSGHKQGFNSLFFGSESHGQHTGDRSQLSIQAHFAQKCACGLGSADTPRSTKNTQKNWQIIMCTGFFQISRCQIYRNAAGRKGYAGVFSCGTNTLPRLLYSGIGKAYDIKTGQSIGNITFRRHTGTPDAGDSQCADTADQGNHSFVFVFTIIPYQIKKDNLFFRLCKDHSPRFYIFSGNLVA